MNVMVFDDETNRFHVKYATVTVTPIVTKRRPSGRRSKTRRANNSSSVCKSRSFSSLLNKRYVHRVNQTACDDTRRPFLIENFLQIEHDTRLQCFSLIETYVNDEVKNHVYAIDVRRASNTLF